MELYKTVRNEAEIAQTIEKSRFIAHVKPVSTREEADAFISKIRSIYKDATHNVPAMVIGDKFQIQWASDDGEPQGTSGAPIVQMLVKEGITNTVVVVTRYYGGIKLGTGGLVRAYTGSAKQGLEAAGICSVREICTMKIRIEYPYLAKLQSIAVQTLDTDDTSAEGFIIRDAEYSDKVVLTICMLPENERRVREIFANITSGGAEIIESYRIPEKV